MEISKVLLVAFVLVICAFVLQVIGLTSPYWLTTETGSTETNTGLWRTCIESALGVTYCVDSVNLYPDDGTYRSVY
jgi:hypothetical protein